MEVSLQLFLAQITGKIKPNKTKQSFLSRRPWLLSTVLGYYLFKGRTERDKEVLQLWQLLHIVSVLPRKPIRRKRIPATLQHLNLFSLAILVVVKYGKTVSHLKFTALTTWKHYFNNEKNINVEKKKKAQPQITCLSLSHKSLLFPSTCPEKPCISTWIFS